MKSPRYSEKVINAFALYTRPVDLVKATGLHKSTIARYKHDDTLEELARERRADFVKDAVSKMQAELYASVDTLAQIRDSKEASEQTRAYACNCLLNQCKDWLTTQEIITRLRKLEEQVNERNEIM